MNSHLEIPLDKIRGLLIGCAIGDALGGPYEKRNNLTYTGMITDPIRYTPPFSGTRYSVVGQITDDTEMTIVLARSLLKAKGFDRNTCIQAYLDWVGSGVSTIGRNTRALFKGVGTIRGYENRLAKATAGPMDEWSISNGSLMRAGPLSLVWDNQAVIGDCSITNPHPISQDCGLIYVTAIRLALLSYPKQVIFEEIRGMPQTDAVKKVVDDVLSDTPWDLIENKGMCTKSLYCALRCFRLYDTLQDALDWTIGANPGSDTDTNGAITGALIGAYLGYDQVNRELKTQFNIKVVRGADSTKGDVPRPIQYSLADFDALTQQLYERFGRIPC